MSLDLVSRSLLLLKAVASEMYMRYSLQIITVHFSTPRFPEGNINISVRSQGVSSRNLNSGKIFVPSYSQRLHFCSVYLVMHYIYLAHMLTTHLQIFEMCEDLLRCVVQLGWALNTG